MLFLASAWSETQSTDKKPISAVDEFHRALQSGDADAAMALLSPDAVILESGAVETREEYKKHHLSEDIEFAKAVNTTTTVPTVTVQGDAAWVSSTSRASGIFHGHDVNSIGAELVVLSKSSIGWIIRSIHWSSHTVKQAQ